MKVALNTQAPHNKYNAPKTLDFRVKYKTQKCRYWEQQGFCPFGQTCAFVHDCLEMRPKDEIHDRYKTKLCVNFNKFAYCKYGERCLFLHQTRQSDRERTRSNSPSEQANELKTSSRHQQNLKILSQYGFSVFEAHMKRNQSKITQTQKYENCNRTSVSTESERVIYDNYESNYDIQDFGNEYLLPIDAKKSRMYSM